MIQYPQIGLSLLILSCFYCRPSNGGVSNTVRCFDRERKALLQFKDGITFDSCGLLNTWRDDTDCCQWRGVQCSNDTGHVIKLRLRSYPHNICLQGKLSSSLGELLHLRHLKLNFSFDQLSLAFLGSLANLEYLSLGDFFSSEANSSMPLRLQESHEQSLNWLSRLRLLRYLQLSGADLSDANNWTHIISNLPFLRVVRMNGCQLPTVNIPSSLTHINSSSNLRIISLSGNYFVGNFIFQWLFSLPGITTRLEYLDLSSNRLEGPIPLCLGSLRHLSYLDLSYDQLEGPIPKGFGNLSHLDLSYNNLEGPIPMDFQSMHSLSYLSLSQNKLQGSVFKIFTRLCNLQQLYLRYNNFTDELTNVIQALLSCEYIKLQKMDLSQNRFWGGIPDSISSFSLLKVLYLDGNRLIGNISQSIGQLGMLEKLYLSSNSLEDTLTPTHFLNLSRLRELSLSDNPSLAMNIDASWDPPFQLDIISLRSCKLGPYFPNWLIMQRNFTYLDVSNAEISDTVPVSFWNTLSLNMKYLNMSCNQFHGSIPNLPHKFVFFFYGVDLSSNLFEGAIPSWFRNTNSLYLNDNRFSDTSDIFCSQTVSFLSDVDLSNNLLSGMLEDCWMSFDELDSLHLENNKFYGNIPQSIGTMKNLRFLHLNNNNFSGPIPVSLENCTSLVILNLGYNSLTGNIPPWIGNFQSLGVLILRRNYFLGEIPSNLCQLSSLQILDFGMNHISGVIPRCISNFTSMTTVSTMSTLFFGGSITYLSHEAISSVAETAVVTWKKEEQKLKSSIGLVKSIDLSFNELSGEIPDGIFNLTGLVSLDLSKNNLNGSISSEIGKLTELELLDLSDNRLTEEIPSSLAKLSFLADLGLSNNNLSGKIPLGTQLQICNASSYTGNPRLCGLPLSKCPGDQTSVYAYYGANTSAQDEHDDCGVFPGLYISVVLGLVVGFWGVFGTLVIKNSWRHAWFRRLDGMRDRFYEIARGIGAQCWRSS